MVYLRRRNCWATVCKTVRPVLSDGCLSCLSCSVLSQFVLWPNGWMDEDETWHAGRPRPCPHCVRWKPSSPCPKGHNPQFVTHICCGQMAGRMKMPFGMEVGLGQGNFVLDGDPAPLPKRGQSPPPVFGPCLLWPNGWMDQDGTWCGSGPWSRPHCVRWGPNSPLQKTGQSPQFSAHLCCGQMAGCIKMALGMEAGLNPGDFVLKRGPS